MNIEFSYREGTNFPNNGKAFLIQESKTFGHVTIRTYKTRFGAIDLVTVLAASLSCIVKTGLQSFVKGFVGEDWLKALGAKARSELIKELKNTKYFIKAYYDCFIRNEPNIEQAYVITENIGDITLFVVLNHYQMTDILLDKLPQALVETYGKISLGYLDIESKICQLFPDFGRNEWRYLFSPTFSGFGNFVDRYYDLNSNEVILITSKEEFINRFDLKEEDKYKLIISGLIER